MTKLIKPTTAKGVSSLLKQGEPGLFPAGQGLYLKVSSTNKGSWIFRYQIKGKRKKVGIGSVQSITLSQARQKSIELKNVLDQNLDPAEYLEGNHSQSKRVTFSDIAQEYIDFQKPNWTNVKHAQQWENTLKTYAYPILGELEPGQITTEHILNVLKPIWNTKQETARRLRNRIETILNVAKVRDLRSGENVAQWKGHLEMLLPKHDRKFNIQHQPALSWEKLPEFYQDLIKRRNENGAQALRLTILTATRTNETINATWSEFDFDKKLWIIPKERMKGKRAHRIPLTDEMLSLLDELPKSNSGFLFESQRTQSPISNMAMLMTCRRMDEEKSKKDGIGWKDKDGRTITVHGFRSTFRDWSAENTNFQNFIVEQALAHTIGSAVEQAYRRSDLLDKRKQLMQQWTRFVT